MPQLAFDDFVRANAFTLGANWTNTEGSWEVFSNSAVVTSSGAGSYSSTYWNAISWPNDQYSQITVNTIDSTGDSPIGPAVRMSSSSETYYWLLAFAGGLYIQLLNAGSYSNIAGPVAYTSNVGDVLYLEIRVQI